VCEERESLVRPGAILGYLGRDELLEGRGGLLEVERFMRDQIEQHML
jgi:hypothetical protein